MQHSAGRFCALFAFAAMFASCFVVVTRADDGPTLPDVDELQRDPPTAKPTATPRSLPRNITSIAPNADSQGHTPGRGAKSNDAPEAPDAWRGNIAGEQGQADQNPRAIRRPVRPERSLKPQNQDTDSQQGGLLDHERRGLDAKRNFDPRRNSLAKPGAPPTGGAGQRAQQQQQQPQQQQQRPGGRNWADLERQRALQQQRQKQQPSAGYNGADATRRAPGQQQYNQRQGGQPNPYQTNPQQYNPQQFNRTQGGASRQPARTTQQSGARSKR